VSWTGFALPHPEPDETASRSLPRTVFWTSSGGEPSIGYPIGGRCLCHSVPRS
jgi:hypothetical protein